MAALVWGLIGAMLAALTLSSALAVGIGIGYLLVFESLIGIVAPQASPYLSRRWPSTPSSWVGPYDRPGPPPSGW